MGIHSFHDTFHQQFVVAFHFLFHHLFLLLLSTRELTLQMERLANKIVDDHMQLIHIERLRQIGIGTFL